MKTIEIEKIETLNDVDSNGPNWKRDTVYYILTSLAALPSGCIVAEWSKAAGNVKWFYTTQPCFLLKPENFEGVLLKQENINDFRMVLNALGFITLEEVYLGIGTFKICFKNGSESDRLYAIIFSNLKGLGYWIKLHVIEELKVEE